MLFLFQSEPVELVKEFGPTAGAVILCAGLFIWNTIQMNSIGTKLEINTKAIEDGNAEFKTSLEAQVQAQHDLAQSIHQLAESLQQQAAQAVEELRLVHEMLLSRTSLFPAKIQSW